MTFDQERARPDPIGVRIRDRLARGLPPFDPPPPTDPKQIAREAEQDRARRRARLADPNTSPLQRRLDEARLRPPLPWWETGEPPPPKPTRKRKRTAIASVIRQMQRAGVEIAGCEINPDGTVRVVTGKPSEATTPDSADSNEWDGVLQ